MSRKNILNLDELEYREWSNGERFAGRMGEIAPPLGAQKLGYNLTVVPAGDGLFRAVSDAIEQNDWAVSELRFEAGRFDEVFRNITQGQNEREVVK